MPAQVLKYYLKIGGSVVTPDLASARVRDAMNELPVATFDLSNKGGKYTFAAAFQEGDPVIFSGSTDGTNFVRLHSGSVLSRNASLGPDGQSMLTVQSRLATVDHKYLDFNNAAQKNLDWGAVFTGSATASDGDAWSSDSKGNYPNGILYNSGLKWDPTNVTNIYAGVPDAPLLMHGNRSVYDAIRSVCEVYGFDSALVPSGSDVYLRVLRHTSNFLGAAIDPPTYGTDINSDELEFDGKQLVNGVVLIGSNGVYFRTGSEPYAQMEDQTVRNYDQARERGVRWLEIHSQSVARGRTTTPPITQSVVGRRVTVLDDDRGWSTVVGNVMAQDHSIRADRWTTDLTYDNVPPETPKLLSDVITEIRERQEREDIGSRYPGFVFSDFSDFGQIASSGSSYSASAMGIGTGGNGVLAILPVRVRDAPIYTFRLPSTPEGLVNRSRYTKSSDLLKTLVLFESPSGSTLVASTSSLLSRPATSSGWGTGSSSSFFLGLGYHVAGVQDILVYGKTFRSGEMDFRVIGHTLSDGLIPNATDSAFEEAPDYVLSNSDKDSMSWDALSKSGEFFRYATNSGALAKKTALRIAVSHGIPKTELHGIQTKWFDVVARCRYTNSSGNPTNSIGVFMYAGVDPFDWSSRYDSGSSDLNQWFHVTHFASAGSADYKFGKDGTYYFAIQNGFNMRTNSGVELDVAYVESSLPMDRRKVVERAKRQEGPSALVWSEPAVSVLGIFDNPSATGIDYRFASVETVVGQTWENDWLAPWGIGRKDVVRVDPVRTELTADRRGMQSTDAPTWLDIQKRYSVSDFYVLYVPERKFDPEPLGAQGWLLDRRSDNGDTKDYLWWINGTDSTDYRRQTTPGYHLTYSVQYTTPGVVRGRYTDSTGWDLTPEKDLTVVFNASG